MKPALSDLDPVIHAPKRLAAMAVLATSESAKFTFLRDYLDVSDSDLSKQMAALESVGYISIGKQGRGRGSVTTYKITNEGAASYGRHVRALQAVIGE